MKNVIKKLLVVACVMLLFTGCSCAVNDNNTEEAVETFFEKYRAKDDNVIEQLKDTIMNEDITDDQKEKYEELMEKQYDQFAYVIKDKKEEDDSATVTAEITVLNYRSAINEAEEELKNNPEKFNNDEGNFSEEKYMDYKIEKMKDVTDTTTHEIDLSLTKNAGIWTVEELSSDDIMKLHGLY